MLSLGDIEQEARWALEHAGADDVAPPPILDVARRIVGARVEFAPHRALRGDGRLVVLHGERRIFVRSGLPAERLRWVVAHELGHFVLGVGSQTQEEEDQADAFAAAILAPRRAYQRALKETGERLSYTKLARWFITSESCVALRYGEVTDVPLALVAPARVRVRGAEFSWPVELRSERVAGLRRVTLRDDRRRVAMRAA